ncbi:TolC family protein, partial [Deinococcus petrolearius]
MSTRSLPFLLVGLLSAPLSPGSLAAAQTSPTPAPVPQQVPVTTAPANAAPATAAPATTAPAAAPLASLDAVLARLRQSPGWRVADLNYRAAQLSLDSARSRAGLNLSVDSSAALVRVPWDGGAWQLSGAVSVGAGLSVLPWSPALEGVRGAERALGAAATELRAVRAGLTLQAAQAYAGARGAAQALALADAGLALSTRLLAVAQAQRAQNLVPEEGLLQSQGALAQAQATQAQAARGVQGAAQSLARLLGGPVTLPGSADAFALLLALGDGTADEAALLAR